ncbi:ABC transporter ATP-binding protein [Candidatus Bathyarchaeota archaeon]|nr:ABC transporter ATP-binding protein [Candidatus Bathyarchaeota archaeon]
MIEVKGLYFSYDGNEVLHNINITIHDGEFIAIMGENGAGKTTLIKHFNGLLKPSKGEVLIDGVSTREATVASLSRKVGLVFQNPDHQLFSETVFQEVAFSMRNYGYPEETIRRRVNFILETLDLRSYAETSPFMLSGGERKRVALASILVSDPKHIVLDEPTIGQDHQQKEKLKNFIVQMNTQGRTVIIVTHDVEFVVECRPKVILLSKGSILAEGSYDEILSDEDLVRRASLVPPQIGLLMSSLRDLGFNPATLDVYQAKSAIEKRLLSNVSKTL